MSIAKHLALTVCTLTLWATGGQAAERGPAEFLQQCSDYLVPADEQITGCTQLIASYGQDISTLGVRGVAYLARGTAHARKGERDSATADYREAIRLDSILLDGGAMEPLLYNDRCWARAIAMIDLDAALADCNTALRLVPGFSAALDSRAFLHLRREQFRDAIADYDAVLKDSPMNFYSLFGRGVAKLRLGDSTGGNADLSAAVAAQAGIREEFAAYGVTP